MSNGCAGGVGKLRGRGRRNGSGLFDQLISEQQGGALWPPYFGMTVPSRSVTWDA